MGLAWDPELGVWYYLEIVRTYICGAACFSVPLADADALREDACAPLPAISGIPGYGPPSLFNRTWPCSHEKASVVKYELVNTKTEETSKYKVNCFPLLFILFHEQSFVVVLIWVSAMNIRIV